MAYELRGSFSPEFFFNEGEPYDVNVEKSDRPTSVWQAIISMDDEKWNNVAKDVFDNLNPEFLTPEAVLEKIEETDTVGTLSSPVDVWIDKDGYYTIDVYDRDRGDADFKTMKKSSISQLKNKLLR